jgi:hypothetical protein
MDWQNSHTITLPLWRSYLRSYDNIQMDSRVPDKANINLRWASLQSAIYRSYRRYHSRIFERQSISYGSNASSCPADFSKNNIRSFAKFFYASNPFIVNMCCMTWHLTWKPNESKFPRNFLKSSAFRNKPASIFLLQETSYGSFQNARQIMCGSWWTIMCLIILLWKVGLKSTCSQSFGADTGRSLSNDSHPVCRSTANISVMLLLLSLWKRSGLS